MKSPMMGGDRSSVEDGEEQQPYHIAASLGGVPAAFRRLIMSEQLLLHSIAHIHHRHLQIINHNRILLQSKQQY